LQRINNVDASGRIKNKCMLKAIEIKMYPSIPNILR